MERGRDTHIGFGERRETCRFIKVSARSPRAELPAALPAGARGPRRAARGPRCRPGDRLLAVDGASSLFVAGATAPPVRPHGQARLLSQPGCPMDSSTAKERREITHVAFQTR